MAAPQHKGTLAIGLAAATFAMSLLTFPDPAEAQFRGSRGGSGFHQGFGGGRGGFGGFHRGMGGGFNRPAAMGGSIGMGRPIGMGMGPRFGGFQRGIAGGFNRPVAIGRPITMGPRFGGISRSVGGLRHGFANRPFVHRTAHFSRPFHHRRRHGGVFATGLFTGAAFGLAAGYPYGYGYPYAYDYPYYGTAAYGTAAYGEECFVVRRRVRDIRGNIVIRRRIVCE